MKQINKLFIAKICITFIVFLNLKLSIAQHLNSCSDNFKNISSKTDFFPLKRETTSETISSNIIYQVNKHTNECCINIAFDSSILKFLKKPQNKVISQKFIQAASNGVVSSVNGQGLKRLHGFKWEIKILGNSGDSRIMGCEKNGVIHFLHFSKDHNDAKNFINNYKC